MGLTIELEPETAQRLFEEARLTGKTPEDLARHAVEERYSRAAQIEKNQAAIRLLEQWSKEPPDPDEAKDYPLEITPLSLREISIE